MKTRKHIKHGSKVSEISNELDLEIEELAGFMGLNMEADSLWHAKKVLRKQAINSRRFTTAVEALLVFANNLKKHRHLVESAFARLKPAERKKAGRQLFSFYVSISDWQRAEMFRPKRPQTSQDLLFSIWTLLGLHKTDEALPVFRKCRKRRLTAERQRNLFDYSMMVEAMACYYAQTREWSKAEDSWEYGLDYEPFAVNAWIGLMKLVAVEGLLKIGWVHKFAPWLLDKNANCKQPDVTLQKKLNEYAAHLTKILPQKEQWRFGL